MPTSNPLAGLLDWYVAMGADEAIGAEARNRLAPAPARPPPPSPQPAEAPPAYRPSPPAALAPPSDAAESARKLAAAARTLPELEAAIRAFEGCALKQTATNTVIADGNPASGLMVIGEAPGADEDRVGKPFVGRAGQLLDRMLAAIGIDRSRAYITNVLYWRPPGNRTPSTDEIAICLPFLWRHIALVNPRVVVLAGGTAASTLLGRKEGIMRLRGRWFELPVAGLEKPVAALATYHPSFLLRAPARKSEAWIDLLSLKAKLEAGA
ncbi:MAG TPA: uracil-DNA glycosylase [Stellaceae bacterium]|nr:uracil-DNA glycosylase [Stellaceae bacterium]